MSRGLWFVAGAGAGIYAVVRGRRAAEALTPDGLRDRAAGLVVGARLFGEEVRSGMAEREAELRLQLGSGLPGLPAPAAGSTPAALAAGQTRSSDAQEPGTLDAGATGAAPRPDQTPAPAGRDQKDTS